MPVGATLASLRRERGRSLADVESATKIMGRMLSSLEGERWDELPAPVYVKGYIQNYASFLRVDAAPLLEEYAHDIAKRPERPERLPLARIPERTVVPHQLDIHKIPVRAWRALAVAAVVVALLAWGISALLGRDKTPTPIAPETSATTQPDGSAPVSGQGTGAAQTPAGTFLLKVSVAEGQSSWVQVRVDSLLAYEGTLPGGDSKQWTVAKDAVVRVGKPAAVTITRDGQDVVMMPPVNGISEVTLTATGK